MDQPYWLDPRLVRAQFNRASSTYDSAAAVINELRQRVLERLDLVRLAPARILDLGAATAIGTRALKDRYPKAQVLALDSAFRMLEQAKRQQGWWRKFDSICADAAALPLHDHTFDLVFSHLALPWCNSPDEVFQEVGRVLRPGGLLMFSSVGPDTARELRSLWGRLDTEIHVHAFIDMHDIGDALVRAGFADPVMDVETLTITYPTFDALLTEARRLGVTNLAAGRPHGLGSKANTRQLRAEYEALKTGAPLPVTVEVVYGHAWASAPRHRASGGEVRVPINQIGRRG
jgi:malonyl-CoA O-methyltransferase